MEKDTIYIVLPNLMRIVQEVNLNTCFIVEYFN